MCIRGRCGTGYSVLVGIVLPRCTHRSANARRSPPIPSREIDVYSQLVFDNSIVGGRSIIGGGTIGAGKTGRNAAMTMIDINDGNARQQQLSGAVIENVPRGEKEREREREKRRGEISASVRLACMRALIIGAPALLIYFVGRSTDKSMNRPE